MNSSISFFTRKIKRASSHESRKYKITKLFSINKLSSQSINMLIVDELDIHNRNRISRIKKISSTDSNNSYDSHDILI